MKKGIATVCMSGMLADKLAAAAEAGYAGVEIFENDLTYFDGSPEDVRAPGGLARARDPGTAALPRFRGPARAVARTGLRSCAAQVRADGPAGDEACSWSAAASRRTRSTTWSGSRPTCTS